MRYINLLLLKVDFQLRKFPVYCKKTSWIDVGLIIRSHASCIRTVYNNKNSRLNNHIFNQFNFHSTIVIWVSSLLIRCFYELAYFTPSQPIRHSHGHVFEWRNMTQLKVRHVWNFFSCVLAVINAWLACNNDYLFDFSSSVRHWFSVSPDKNHLLRC